MSPQLKLILTFGDCCERMITKIEAAEKQLDSAIKLFFENVDHLSCYTLAAASREITDDLCDKRKNERLGDPQKVRLSFRDELEILIKPEHLKEAMRLFKKPQNFLKHADRDHNQELDELSIKEISLVIFFAIMNFVLLEKRWSPAMATFSCWFTAVNPDLIDVNASKDHTFLKLAAKMRRDFSGLNSERVFYIVYEDLKIHAPYLFPQKSP
jgi:hypothetical protein